MDGWGVMEFVGLFFSWWGFFAGVVVGSILASLAVTFGLPSLYRMKRRHDLRRMWRMDQVRSLSESLVPRWTEYDPDIESVDRRCICHGTKIGPGERAMLWPEVGPLGLLYTSVYCNKIRESA